MFFRAVAEGFRSSYQNLDSFGDSSNRRHSSNRDDIAEAKFYDVYYGNRVGCGYFCRNFWTDWYVCSCMNLDYLLQRIIGRATCQLGRDARLYSAARIRNASGKSECIRVGSCSIIKGELFVFSHGGEIDIGEWCYVGDGAKIWSARSILIGNRVLISHSVNIFDSLTHPFSATARHEQFRAIATSGHPPKLDLDEKEVRIGDDALLGANSIILRGVNVGGGAIVGAGSVVTRDVPPNTIVAGNPARVIRELHPDER